MKICNTCGAKLPDNARYCNNCGTEQKTIENIYCIFCGTKNSGDSEFCIHCGASIEPIVCSDDTTNAGPKSCSAESLAAFNYVKLANGKYMITGLQDAYTKEITIPTGVEYIADAAFESTKIIKAVLPESLLEIGNNAFKNCKMLSDINFPSTLSSIGDSAFEGCESLDVIIPKSVKRVGKNVLADTAPMKQFEALKTVCEYVEYQNCTYGITGVKNNTIVSATIPTCVISIGDNAFSGCSRLTDLTIPESVRWIGTEAFSGCQSLTSITIPEGATIRMALFNGCSNLKKVVLADSVKRLSYELFKDCWHLQEIFLPDSITSIDGRVFEHCFELTFINIPDEVTAIPYNAFTSCRNLKSILIGSGVITIDFEAFAGCESLDAIYYKGSSEKWDKIDISSGNSELISATRYYYSEQQPTEDGSFWHYGENGEIEIWD